MNLHMTDRAILLDAALRESRGEGLVDAALRLTDEGLSSREVALWLKDATGMRVSHETIRGWEIEWRHAREQEPAA